MGMKLRFADENVYAEGRHVRYLDLAEGQRVLCRVFADVCHECLLYLEAGRLQAVGFAVERWGELTVLRAECRAEPRAVRQAVQRIDGMDYMLTASCEASRTVAWLERATEQSMLLLPAGEDVEIAFSASMLAVAVCVVRRGGRYLAVLALPTAEVLYEGAVDEYALGDTLEVVCTLEDMRRHTIRTTWGYRGADFCTLAQSFTCANAHTYTPKLVPYLFAEALAAGDREEARGYLTAELAASLDALLGYVGEVSRVDYPPVACGPYDVGVVSAEEGRVFAFEMEGDKIADVRRVQ